MNPRRFRLLTAVLSIAALAACGGGEAEIDAGQPATTSPTGQSEDVIPTTATPTTDDVDDATSPGPGETFAVLNLNGETYTFGVSERTKCDPARLGGLYEATLAHLDASGQPIGTEGILVALAHDPAQASDGQGRTISLEVNGTSWIAGGGTGAGFPGDTHVVDGRSAEATLTFVNEAGDEAEGTLEVYCAEG